MAETPSAQKPQKPTRSSREAFVESTVRLLRRKGYAASGLNEIVARSGAPKGSLYFHFPGGKQELALAAMERAGGQLREAIAAVLDSSEDLPGALAALVDSLAAGMEASGYRDGCPIATITLETAGESETLRATASEVFGSWLEVVEQRLLAAGLSPADAARRALFVLAAIEGALILARAQRDLGPLTAVRDELAGAAQPQLWA